MFRRFFKGNNSNANNKQQKKKRVSPTSSSAGGVATAEKGPGGLSTTGSVDTMTPAPGYQYALNEFAQTVAPATSNDDGLRSILRNNSETTNASMAAKAAAAAAGYVEPPSVPSTDESSFQSPTSTQGRAAFAAPSQSLNDIDEESSSAYHNIGHTNSAQHSYPAASAAPYSSYPYRVRQTFPATTQQQLQQQMPDSFYEEWYGDAYLGGPVKYIYPSGYQSMRPRGGPWRLSIAICVLFTWLSVFIIGHCSDRVDQSVYEAYGQDIDDDKMAIEVRWCGSQLLYMMWVVSMLITGLASAYCGVIGYIKVRDFAVANTRSQPPELVGKSDYYVQLQDPKHILARQQQQQQQQHRYESTPPHNHESHHEYYQRTIYQSDGNPQFWGGHIYRPTQAAAAVTNR
jgi:hypothetical protein